MRVVFGLFLSLSSYLQPISAIRYIVFNRYDNYPDGRYEIEEDIQMFFKTNGFYQDIPTRYDFEDPRKPDIRARVSIRANEELSINSTATICRLESEIPTGLLRGLRENIGCHAITISAAPERNI